MTRKYIKESTSKELYAKSGNQCAFPECNQQLYPDNNSENHSNICHIEAAEESGQRYNPESNDEDRRSIGNLIILCSNHHRTTNDVSQYSVEDLLKMKASHERKVAQKMISDNPSMILNAINALAEVEWDSQIVEDNQSVFSIEEKLNHNSVKIWKPTITEYKVYKSKIDSIYDQLEQNGEFFKKSNLLLIIKQIYLRTLGEYLSNNPSLNRLGVVQKHADDILDKVQEKLLQIANGKEDDNFTIAMPIIMVDAFMRCKILEPPTEK